MTKPIVSYRRIDQLKAIAFDGGFTNEDAKQFGKLTGMEPISLPDFWIFWGADSREIPNEDSDNECDDYRPASHHAGKESEEV